MTDENTIELIIFTLAEDAWLVKGTDNIDIARGALTQFFTDNSTDPDEYNTKIDVLNISRADAQPNFFLQENENGTQSIQIGDNVNSFPAVIFHP